MTETILKLIAIALLLSPLAVASFQERTVETVLTKTIKGAFAVSSAAGLILLLVQLAVVLLRSVFSVSFIWLQESTLYLFGAMFLLSSGALLLSEGHVRVDIIYNKLSERMKSYVDLVGLSLLVLPLTILIIWVSWSYVGTSWMQLERSQEATGIHAVFLLKSMIPAFAVLLAFAAEVRIIQIFRQLREAR
ncbi:MAG: TRAP transporter small permease subunit [Parvularculaceae bacterium]|nr:TRAP transporter small permease subunit [Parvularculaceae bacterium]